MSQYLNQYLESIEIMQPEIDNMVGVLNNDNVITHPGLHLHIIPTITNLPMLYYYYKLCGLLPMESLSVNGRANLMYLIKRMDSLHARLMFRAGHRTTSYGNVRQRKVGGCY